LKRVRIRIEVENSIVELIIVLRFSQKDNERRKNGKNCGACESWRWNLWKQGKKNANSFFYIHTSIERVLKKKHMPSMERRALENKVSENRMGNNFQDSLF
jgi:hypothetical protein